MRENNYTRDVTIKQLDPSAFKVGMAYFIHHTNDYMSEYTFTPRICCMFIGILTELTTDKLTFMVTRYHDNQDNDTKTECELFQQTFHVQDIDDWEFEIMKF